MLNPTEKTMRGGTAHAESALYAGAALTGVPLLAALRGTLLSSEPGHWIALLFGAALVLCGAFRLRRT
jgi:hypothetical protein